MDAVSPQVWAVAHTLVSRQDDTNSTTSTTSSENDRPPVFKAVGLSLAVASGIFIGISFVMKKVGLLKANAKYNEEAGEGYGYLKNAYWWGGMTLMIVGEICNFVAYAFVDAILVTPLGALSVVVTTILSAIFLKERLSFVGKVGCFNCIVGSVVIVLNAPEQSAVADIQQMKNYVISPGFLSYAGVVIVACLFVALWVAPRYGKKSMLVYLSICSFIGGLSVVATQGLGSAVVAQIGGKPQFNQWFLYVLLVFVIATLLTEIIYLNKALNIFNAALVTPTYYVVFTSATIITSAILFRGFKGTPISITTVIMGFLQICTGVVLLQMSKSAKDVPDAAVFKGDLDQVREIGEVEQPETEPKADAIRGTAALIRRISVSRQKMEQEEARRLREDTLKDQLEPVRENEIVEWDGLRRRKTIIGQPGSPLPRRPTVHYPLGMSHYPDPEDEERHPSPGFFQSLRGRSQTARHASPGNDAAYDSGLQSSVHPVALDEIKIHPANSPSSISPYGPGSREHAQEHIYGLARGERRPPDDKSAFLSAQPSPRSKPLAPKLESSPNLPASHEARRQFSFTNFLRPGSRTPDVLPSQERPRLRSRGSSATHDRRATRNATEEERLGLVKGDSHLGSFDESHHRAEPCCPSTSPPPYASIPHTYRDFLNPRGSPNLVVPRARSDSDQADGWQMTSHTTETMAMPTTIMTNPGANFTNTGARPRPTPPETCPATWRDLIPASTREEPASGVRTVVEGGLGPIKATPVASDHSRISSTNHYRPPNQGHRHDQFSRPNDGEGHRITVFEEQPRTDRSHRTSVHGPILAEGPSEYEVSRRRFEEQSQREREERRLRATGRRQSWKPSSP